MVIEDSNKLVVKDLKAAIKPKKDKKKVTTEPAHVEEADARESRGHWKHPLDFLFSCISVSVGLGSKSKKLEGNHLDFHSLFVIDIWRFPYLCYKNGGGVFLIIYFISMLFCGIPVFLLEVSIGQYLGAGGMTTIAQICPILKGAK